MTSFALPQDAQDLLFLNAHTANSFTEQPVSIDQLQAIYDLIKYAPTAMNAQPLRITFVGQGESRDRLLKHMADGNRDKTASAPVVAILAADTDFHLNFGEHFPHASGLADTFGASLERREQFARFNAGLQAGYFLLGVRAAGLAAGPMAGFDASGIDEEFYTDKPWRSFLVVNLGHPGENAFRARLPRLSFERATEIV